MHWVLELAQGSLVIVLYPYSDTKTWPVKNSLFRTPEMIPETMALISDLQVVHSIQIWEEHLCICLNTYLYIPVIKTYCSTSSRERSTLSCQTCQNCPHYPATSTFSANQWCDLRTARSRSTAVYHKVNLPLVHGIVHLRLIPSVITVLTTSRTRQSRNQIEYFFCKHS